MNNKNLFVSTILFLICISFPTFEQSIFLSILACILFVAYKLVYKLKPKNKYINIVISLIVLLLCLIFIKPYFINCALLIILTLSIFTFKEGSIKSFIMYICSFLIITLIMEVIMFNKITILDESRHLIGYINIIELNVPTFEAIDFHVKAMCILLVSSIISLVFLKKGGSK